MHYFYYTLFYRAGFSERVGLFDYPLPNWRNSENNGLCSAKNWKDRKEVKQKKET